MKPLAILLLSLLIYGPLRAQPDWKRIDRSIEQGTAIDFLADDLREMLEEARKKNDYLQQAGLLSALLKIRDKTTEDSLYFRNSVFIDSILQEPSTPELLKFGLHYLLWERLNGFRQLYRKHNIAKYRVAAPQPSYNLMTYRSLDSIADLHIVKALEIAKKYPLIKESEFAWMKFPNTFLLFEPELADAIFYILKLRAGNSSNATLYDSKKYVHEPLPNL